MKLLLQNYSDISHEGKQPTPRASAESKKETAPFRDLVAEKQQAAETEAAVPRNTSNAAHSSEPSSENRSSAEQTSPAPAEDLPGTEKKNGTPGRSKMSGKSIDSEDTGKKPDASSAEPEPVITVSDEGSSQKKPDALPPIHEGKISAEKSKNPGSATPANHPTNAAEESSGPPTPKEESGKTPDPDAVTGEKKPDVNLADAQHSTPQGKAPRLSAQGEASAAEKPAEASSNAAESALSANETSPATPSKRTGKATPTVTESSQATPSAKEPAEVNPATTGEPATPKESIKANAAAAETNSKPAVETAQADVPASRIQGSSEGEPQNRPAAEAQTETLKTGAEAQTKTLKPTGGKPETAQEVSATEASEGKAATSAHAAAAQSDSQNGKTATPTAPGSRPAAEKTEEAKASPVDPASSAKKPLDTAQGESTAPRAQKFSDSNSTEPPQNESASEAQQTISETRTPPSETAQKTPASVLPTDSASRGAELVSTTADSSAKLEPAVESTPVVSPAPSPTAEPVAQQSAPSPAPTPSPVPADRVMHFDKLSENIDKMILRTLRTDSNSMRIELQPAELGRMVMHCRETRAGLTVEISVQSQEVRNLLESTEQNLRSTLENQGMQISRFSVSCKEGDPGGSNGHSNSSFSRHNSARNGHGHGHGDAFDGDEEEEAFSAKEPTWMMHRSRNHWVV